jgi:hypothetical protein
MTRPPRIRSRGKASLDNYGRLVNLEASLNRMDAVDIEELYQRKERLNDELLDYIDYFDGGRMVRLFHPLYVTIGVDLDRAAAVNHFVAQNSQTAAAYWRKKQWAKYIWMHAKPFRSEALLRCRNAGFTGRPYWRLLSAISG